MKTPATLTLFFLLSWASAHPSVSILMDSKGNVYYSDLKQVWKIDRKPSVKYIFAEALSRANLVVKR